MSNMKKISIISPTYNEEANIRELYIQVLAQILKFPQYQFEILFIDNASIDNTPQFLREIASQDQRVKVIINTRNFGHIRSPYWGILQTSGDATIYLASDFQDPPELIPSFIAAWEAGAKIALAVKPLSKGNVITHFLRKSYYRLLDRISDVAITNDSTGFGLYDKCVIDHLRTIADPYPFLRGLICELGYEIKTIPFIQPRRLRGISKNNIYTLYDIAMLGIVSHSLVPIRLLGFFGLLTSLVCFVVAIVFLVLKIIWWDSFPMGYAPILILTSFMFGIVLISIAVMGEYVASIHTYVRNRPIVVEKERINFDV
jgi:dolichol-phosphate mannosyltransferase